MYLFLPFIPGNAAWARTPITPGVGIDLEVLEVGVPSTVELGVANDVDSVPAGSRSTCPSEWTIVERFPARLAVVMHDTQLSCWMTSEKLRLHSCLQKGGADFNGFLCMIPVHGSMDLFPCSGV